MIRSLHRNVKQRHLEDVGIETVRSYLVGRRVPVCMLCQLWVVCYGNNEIWIGNTDS